MTRTELGKIKRIKVGPGGYQDAMFGVTLELGGQSWGVSDFKGTWGPSIEVTSHTKWTEADRMAEFATVMTTLAKWCDEAKVNDVAALVGKPVEVTFDGMTLKSWRLLTEVL